jgi:transcriptional regulator with XRE-family HTH domain
MSNHPDEFTEYVARSLDAERSAARLTVDELAERSGVAKRTLYRILNAERDISIAQLAQLAPVFGLRPSDIFADAERRMNRARPSAPDAAAIDAAPELTDRQKAALKRDVASTRLPHANGRDRDIGSPGASGSASM